VTIDPAKQQAFERMFSGMNTGLVGTVDETSRFRINGRNGGLIIDEDIIQLKDCWKRTFGGLI